jgi:hypothetical protein
MDESALLSLDSPSRRWDLVLALVAEGHAPSRADEDKLIRDGFYFKRREIKLVAHEITKLQRDYPDLYRAHALHMSPAGVRWVIEAGLLTNVGWEALSAYTAQPASALKLYADYFFDVKDKLAARGYILSQILHPSINKGLDQRDFDFMYKTLAYCGGWDVFTEFIDLKRMSDKTGEWVRNSFQDRVWKLGWIASHRVNVNNFNAVELIEKCLDLMRMEREEGKQPARDAALVLVKNLLNQCQMTMIPSAEELPVDEVRAGVVYEVVPGGN